MKPWERTGLVVGASAGMAVASVAAGAAALRRGADGRRRSAPVGSLAGVAPADRTTTVAAEDGVPLVVEERGDPDAPVTVVLVHGFCLAMESWVFQRRDLAERPDVRVVCYDQRSHGRSGTSSAAGATIDQLGRDLQSVLRTVAPTGDVVLVGHSMGGMTIMALARQRPDLVGGQVVGVVLVATAAGGIGASRLGLSSRNPVLEGLRRLGGVRPDLLQRGRAPVDSLIRPVVRAMSYGDRGTDPEVVAFSARMIADTPLQTVLDFVPTLTEHDEHAALPALAPLPVAVVCGDADRMTPYRYTTALTEALPDAEEVRVRGAGHLVQLEAPETVSDTVLRVVDRALERRRHVARRRA